MQGIKYLVQNNIDGKTVKVGEKLDDLSSFIGRCIWTIFGRL